MSTQQLGSAAEQAALEFLEARHLYLVERNYCCRLGEIDLIMRDPDTLIFVEVRLRHDTRYGTGAETVTRSKMRKIINTAEYFLVNHPLWGNLDCRFDVVSMSHNIDWIQNAFTLDD